MISSEQQAENQRRRDRLRRSQAEHGAQEVRFAGRVVRRVEVAILDDDSTCAGVFVVFTDRTVMRLTAFGVIDVDEISWCALPTTAEALAVGINQFDGSAKYNERSPWWAFWR